VLDATGIRLTKIEATRLWYRCGIKLSNLDDVIKAKPQGAERKISFEDFQSILQRIVEDDEKYLSIMALNDPDASDFEVRSRPSFLCTKLECLFFPNQLTISLSIGWREGRTR
jgi:hypothetical protein